MTPSAGARIRFATMVLSTALSSCVLRPWAPADRDNLVRHANNRKVWRNMTASFPHPYTEADADRWLAFARDSGRDLHLARG